MAGGFDYAKAQSDGQALIAEFGQTATLTRYTAGAYNTANGEAAKTSAAWSVSAVKLPLSSSKASTFGLSLDQGGKTLQHLEYAIISGQGSHPFPRATDTLTIGSDVWNITASRELNPAGTPVIYGVLMQR